MKTSILSLIIVVGAFIGLSEIKAEMGSSKVIAVMVHSDHCGSCKILDPEIQAAKKQLEGKSVQFVKFDITNEKTKKASAQVAEKKELKAVYKKVGGKSGKMYLLDGKTKEIKATITKADNKGAIVSKIKSLM